MSILAQLQKTKASSHQLGLLSDFSRRALLLDIASGVEKGHAEILSANLLDISELQENDPKRDRLLLNSSRLDAIALSIRHIAQLEDPVGTTLLDRKHENGLHIRKITVPMGVIGVIYESRPNVTLDVACLCFRSGNACVLKGGKEAFNSNQALVNIIHNALVKNELSIDLLCFLPPERTYLTEFLHARRYVDLLIPRGSESLIQFVRENARIPVIETGAGVVHTYVESSANLEMAAQVVINAKTSRPSVCNALDCLLVDQSIAEQFLPKLISGLAEFSVRIHADQSAYSILDVNHYPHLLPATDQDYGKEWLDFDLSIRCVENLDEALGHIAAYSSRHSEAIITEVHEAGNRFLYEVDAAAVYVNASTRFTDGGEFGLGAEIGISTQKLHARGPFALEKLVTEKWIVVGNGQIRG